jgi:hypothetical protein
MPMIVMTTSSSTKVNALRRDMGAPQTIEFRSFLPATQPQRSTITQTLLIGVQTR